MLQKVKITRVFKSDKGKDDKPFVGKNGKPFWKVGIQTDRTGDEWYSTICFKNDAPEMNMKEGDEVELLFEKNGSFNNFKLPNKTDLLEMRVKAIEEWIKGQMAVTPSKIANTDMDYPENINPESIPF